MIISLKYSREYPTTIGNGSLNFRNSIYLGMNDERTKHAVRLLRNYRGASILAFSELIPTAEGLIIKNPDLIYLDDLCLAHLDDCLENDDGGIYDAYRHPKFKS